MELGLLVGLGGVPIVAALATMVRDALGESGTAKRLTPVVAVIVGCGWNLGLVQAGVTGVDANTAILYGIITGAAASGYYDVRKRLKK